MTGIVEWSNFIYIYDINHFHLRKTFCRPDWMVHGVLLRMDQLWVINHVHFLWWPNWETGESDTFLQVSDHFKAFLSNKLLCDCRWSRMCDLCYYSPTYVAPASDICDLYCDTCRIYIVLTFATLCVSNIPIVISTSITSTLRCQ